MSDALPTDDPVPSAAASPAGERGLAPALAWTTLYVVAQIAAFRLTRLVPYSAYPHLATFGDILATHRLELAVLVVQAIALVLELRGRVRLEGVRQLLDSVGLTRAAVVASIVGISLAIPTQSGARFVAEAAMAAWIVAMAVANLVLIGRAWPADSLKRIQRWVDERLTLSGANGSSRRWDRALPWIAAGWTLALAASLSWFALEGVPHIDDSVAYLFQARTFALGRLSVAPPPDSVSFAVPHLLTTGGGWFSKYFPGWPLLLSLGVTGRVPWLVNPVLGAVAILLAHALLRRLYGAGMANVVVLLLACSPWLITSSGEMMSHPAALAFGLLALLAIELQRGRRANSWSVIAGAALGALFLVRPPDAAALGVVAALWAWGLWGERLSLGSLATIAVVAVAVAAVSLPYNAALTGDPLMAPHRAWSDAMFGPNADVFGFGPGIGIPLWRDHDPLPGHGILDVVINTNRNLYLLSSELFGWAAGSLWLLLLGITLKRKWRHADRVLMCVVVAVIGLHFAYWYPGGPDIGPRYWYPAIVPLAVFTVHGATAFGAQVARLTGGKYGMAHVAMPLVIASVTAVGAGLPWRGVSKYHRYREIGGEVRAMARSAPLKHALVFVHATDRTDYQAAFNFNSPTLDGPGPVFALDAGPVHRAAVLKRYPDRPVWIIGRPPDGTPRLQILGGPYAAGQDPRSALDVISARSQ